MEGQDSTPGFPDSPQPLIYVSAPLAALRAIEQRESGPWVEEVAAILAATEIEGCEFELFSGLEIFRHWPEDIDSDAATEQIFRLNSNAAWAYTDALITFRVSGGSTGGGVELAWACTLGVPILYLHPEGEAISRLVRGMQREADLVVASVRGEKQARHEVRNFLLPRMPLIQDLARRRASWHRRLEPLHGRLAAAWGASSEDERRAASAAAGLTSGRAQRLVGEVSALAAAGLREVPALSAALGIDFGSGPDLQPHQLQALTQAATRHSWSSADTLQLYEIGRLEMQQPTKDKWALGDEDEWLELYRESFEPRQRKTSGL